DILDLLRTDGLAVVPFTKLFDDGFWSELAAESAGFESRVEGLLSGKPAKAGKPGKAVDEAKAAARAPKAEAGAAKKKFVMHRSIAPGTELTLSNPWLRLAGSQRMLDLVNTYLRLWAKLSYVDQWYSVPGGSEAERIGSQRWHRD